MSRCPQAGPPAQPPPPALRLSPGSTPAGAHLPWGKGPSLPAHRAWSLLRLSALAPLGRSVLLLLPLRSSGRPRLCWPRGWSPGLGNPRRAVFPGFPGARCSDRLSQGQGEGEQGNSVWKSRASGWLLMPRMPAGRVLIKSSSHSDKPSCRTATRTLPCPQRQCKAVPLFAPPPPGREAQSVPRERQRPPSCPLSGQAVPGVGEAGPGPDETLCAGIGPGNPGVVGRSRKGSSKGLLLGPLP